MATHHYPNAQWHGTAHKRTRNKRGTVSLCVDRRKRQRPRWRRRRRRRAVLTRHIIVIVALGGLAAAQRGWQRQTTRSTRVKMKNKRKRKSCWRAVACTERCALTMHACFTRRATPRARTRMLAHRHRDADDRTAPMKRTHITHSFVHK